MKMQKGKSATLNYQNLVLQTVKQKYPYLLFGLTVLIVAYLIFSGFLSKNKITLLQPANKEETMNKEEKPMEGQKKYVIKAGEDLWHIAETTYGSGYNAYDVARVNNLSNPSLIEIGQELVLPSLTPKEPTKGEVSMEKTEQVTITGAQYTIQSGDYLWKIALEAYGDGYAWIRIAQANQLSDPNLIYTGNVLVIPR